MSPRRRSPAWRTRVGSLAFVAGLLACNGIITGPDDGPDTRPRSMRVTPARLDLVVGATGQMAAELYDVTGAPAVPEPGVPLGFVSEDPLVATVDGNGLVTAVGGGTTSVRAVYGALRLGIPVVVTAFPPRIELVSGGSQSAEQGSPLGAPVVVRALGSTGAPVAGVAVGFAVDTGAGAGAVGSASVTTDAAGLAQTTWTLGARLGAQSLTATAAGYQALSVPATAVPSTRVQRIDVSPAVATLPVVGATVQLVAEAFNPFDAVIPGTLFTWSSADASIAAVNATGLVTAVAPGTVAITASTGADSGSAVITVAPPAPSPVIGLAPTALAFDVVAGSPSPAAQQVAVTNTGTGTLSGLSATVTYGTGATGWLASALDGTTAPATLTVTPATGALAAGTYTADVTVASSVPGVAPASVGVTLTVRAPIGRLDLGADTTHPAALQDARTLTLVDAPAGTLAVTLRSLDPAALLLAGDSATAGASSLTVSATAGATAVGYWLQGIEGTAGATARLVAEAPGYAPDTMRVSLVSPGVTFTLASADPVDAAAGDDPLLLVRVGANGPGGFRELAVRAFGAEPVFDILALDPSVGTLAFRATAATGGADQLGVDSARFTLRAGRSATLLPDAALGQPASLSVLRSGAPGTARFALASRSGFTLVGANPQVTVTVGAAIEVSPTSLALDVVAGDPSPAPRQFSVTNRGTGALTGLSVSLGWVGNPGLVCCWVTASLDGTTAPATLTVTPTTDAVPAGSYAGEILIASSMPGVDPVAIPMTLVVRAPALPRLDLGPDLRHPAGLQARRMVQVPDAVVDPVMVTIRSLDSTGVLLSVTEVDAGVARDSVEIAGGAREAFYWMQGVEGRAGSIVTLVAEAPGYAPDTMVVTLSNPAFVAQQTGDSSVPATGGEDPVIRLLVGDEVSPGLFSPMAVRAGGTPPSFTATTETPATANVQFFAGPAVIGADQGPATSVTFAIAPTNSATADGTGAAVPASLRLARTGTAGGATVSVAGPSGYVALAPTVSFTLTAVPAPAIAVTPASIDLNTTVGATPPAARDLSVTNGGTGTLSGLSADVAYGPGASDWLALSLSGTTAPATLTVTPATAGVPEGIYTATITIASSLPDVDSVEVAVTLTVDPAPPSGVVNWINPAGGQFGDGANWSTGTVPGAADTAVIALPGTYTVIHVDDLLEVGRLVVGGAGGTGDTVTLAFSAVRFSAEGGIQVNAGGVVDITGGPMSGGSAGMVNDGTLFLRDFNSYPASITSALSGGGTIHVDGIVEITGALTTQNSTRLEIATVSADSAVLTVANGFEMRGQIVLSNVDAENARLAALVVTNGVLRLEEPGRLFSEYGTQGGERVLRAELDNGYWMHVRHPLTIDRPGAAHRSSGYIELSDNGSLTILQSGASPSFTNTQSIILLDDRELIVTGGVFAQRGRVLGVGTVDVSASSIAPATEFAPGFGVLRITGDLPLGSESVLLYEARSASLATDGYGRIPVSGAATLAGALQFSLVDGFVPAIGDSFTLLTASSVTGTFGQLFLPSLPAGEWAIDYNATSVVLRVASAAPPAVTLDIAGDDIVGVGLSTTVDVALTAPAGAAGVTVTVTSDDPSRVRVPAPGTVVIAAGGSSGSVQVDGLALGSTTLRANAAGYTEGTLAVAATNQIISVPTTLNVPFGLTTSIPVQLATPAPAGGVTVTLSSSDPSRVGVVTSTVAFAAGATLASGTLSGVSIGTATITASAPGWVSDQTAATTSAELNVVESSLAINAGFGGTMTVELRSGGSSISAPSPGVTVSLTAVDAGCVTVPATLTIATGSTSATAPVSYGGSATTPCATHVRATATNMQPDSINVTVAPAPGISVSEVTLGEGTQVASNASLLASNYGSTTVRVESSDPSLVLVAPNATTVGSAFTDFPLTAPNQNVSFVLQALEGVTGTATITVSAPGFATSTATVTVRGLGLDIIFLPTSTTSLSPNSAFQARLGTLNAAGTGIQAEHALRFGGTARTVTITNSNAAAAQLVTTALTGQSVTAQVGVGENRTAGSVAAGGVEFDPLSSGTTTVTASSPGVVSLAGASASVTVTTPGISVSEVTLGEGTQVGSNASLLASNYGSTTVRVESSDPSLVLVAPNATTVGSAFTDFPLTAPNQNVSFTLQALEGVTGTATITVSAPGFATGTATVTVRGLGLDVIFLPTSTTSLSPNSPFQVRLGTLNAAGTGIQAEHPLRFGGTARTVTVTNSAGTVGQLVTTAVTGQSVTAQVEVGGNRTAASVATGGVEFDPLSGGTTTVTASSPGVVSLAGASASVTVTTPGISVSEVTLGEGTQVGSNASLLASNYGSTTVRVESSDPSLVLVAPNGTTVGSAFTDFPLTAPNQNVSFVLQALEGVTGTATITVSAPGFATGTATVTVRGLGLDIIFLPTSTTSLSPNSPFQARLGTLNAAGTAIQAEHPLRFGGAARTVTVTNGTGTVGQLVTTAVTGQSVTAQVEVGGNRTAASVAAGGVEFDPLSSGTTTVTASSPGVVSLAGASASVTVTTPGISVSDVTLGEGTQVASNASLLASNYGSTTVRVESSNPSLVLVAPNATTVGSAFTDFPLTAPNQNVSFVLQALEGVTGTATITVSAPGFVTATATVTVRGLGIDILFLPTSTSAGATNSPFQVRLGTLNAAGTGIQAEHPLRFGGAARTVTVTNSSAAAARLVTTALTGQSVTAQIVAGQNRTASGAAAGGVEFDPLASGTTTVTASSAGALALPGSSVTVTVSP